MKTKLLVFWGVTGAALSAALAALAQGHGVPTPERVYGDGVTWPVKIDIQKYDMKKLVAPPTISPAAQDGRILWLQKCGYCHDGVGAPTYRTMGPFLGGDLVKNLGESNVKAFIKSGDVRMPAFKYGLSDQQIDSLVEFIKTIPADQKPTAAQLAGRGGGQAASD